MDKRGFTMIEFLVVAALIGIIATLGMGSYTRSLSRGRDAKRVADLKEIQKGFELYYGIESKYSDCDTMLGDNRCFPNGKIVASGKYVYSGSCTADGYTYCSELENGEDYGNSVCNDNQPQAKLETGMDQQSTCVYQADGTTHYCVSNLQ